MINNNQLELLKYKIKINDEFIKITENSLKLLFSNFGFQTSATDEKLNEILIFLLKYRKRELVPFDLVDIGIKCLNLNVIKFLTSELYSFQIFQSSLEWVVINSNSLFLNESLGSLQSLHSTDSIGLTTISIIIKNIT
ncbi:hypothetical protein DDB_G0294006 [Dictyostelium discoideum AX4]|uniref:Uncharacterized protein n=1 Tax=Dictyostelium discoideum TaxID=44689 RepID=Q54B05_DICDI|nr:hypothetical protein DDB_G0294006 [Dictyostelium discoideum AX4]EAL60445.1 hypothetical protein DDB_G0294006 [Dictyostelium discoideum AX4]|eukprot:XP_628854.1 hypothetical protein DDB_G0294006 [Dictyostelium discoideum AX4]